MTDAIPEISAADLLGPEGAARLAAEAAVVSAAMGSGFMTLSGADAALGFAPDLRDRLLGWVDLPEAVKRTQWRRKFDPAAPNVYRGAFPLQPGAATWKEGIDLGPDLVDPGRANPADPLTEPTPAPSEAVAPGWRAAAAEYYLGMERLGRALVVVLARGLGLPEAETLRLFDGGISTLRIIHYPERPAESLPEDLTLVTVEGDARMVVGGAHCDNGFVTLLWQDPQGGLQARGRDGRWVDVPALDGGLAVNFGRMLADLSGGRVRATEHRVLGGLRRRVSAPFFLEPAVDAPVATEDGVRAYGDLLWERMSAFPEYRGVERRPAA